MDKKNELLSVSDKIWVLLSSDRKGVWFNFKSNVKKLLNFSMLPVTSATQFVSTSSR